MQNNVKEFLLQYKDLEARALEGQAECLPLMINIENLILDANIKDNYKEVLRMRFLEGFSCIKISQKTHLNVDWVHRLQKRGLEALTNTI